MENDLKDMMSSLEFVHAEVTDLKEENEKRKAEGHKTDERLEKLEDLNTALKNRVIDLQARSMRDNLIFYNINEMKDEDQTDIVHGILEN
jgi:peptidoglycan hydrolase CwlO-like protein